VGERLGPITVSVIQHRLHAIVEEMGEAMLRTSYSQILNSSRDGRDLGYPRAVIGPGA
jgi:N-methylhydantoinase B